MGCRKRKVKETPGGKHTIEMVNTNKADFDISPDTAGKLEMVTSTANLDIRRSQTWSGLEGTLTPADVARYYTVADLTKEESIGEVPAAEEEESSGEHLFPGYQGMVREMFHRYCGICEYSISNTLMARGDFEKMLKALKLDGLNNGFLEWFPEPKVLESGQAYVDLDTFTELF